MKKIFFVLALAFSMTLGICAQAIEIDYDDAADDMYEYLEEILKDSEKEPDDDELSEIADYIEYAANMIAVVDGTVENGAAKIDANAVKEAYYAGCAETERYLNMLSEDGITLNRELHCEVRVFLQGTAADALTVTIDYANLIQLQEVYNTKIVYGGNNEYISLTGSDAASIAEHYAVFGVQIKNVSGVYSLMFLDENGASMDKYPLSIGMGIPSHSANNTVYIFYNNTSDNWGGQYNAADGLIEFMTPYSGDYSVAAQDITITDIADLSAAETDAIEFMVIRGCFDADGGLFRPYDSLSRYEYARALVQMMFALDNEAECTFPDVDAQNYRYVAASEQRNIVLGFEDHTFRGEQAVTGEEVTALAARTINEQKGYIYPEKISTYLNFDKSDTISDWARKEVALAVREGIYDPAAGLDFAAAVTRKDAAVILYRLYMILYNTPAKAIADGGGNYTAVEHNSFYTPLNTIIVVSVLILVDAVIVFFAVRYVRRNKKRRAD